VGDTASILVRFTPQGATCLGVPASLLTGGSASLEGFFPSRRIRELQGRVLDAQSSSERVQAVEDFLLSLPFDEDPLVERSLQLIETSDGVAPSVATQARLVGLSERQFERRFLRRVGLTPKRYASLRRFERAVALASTSPSLTDAALDAGYYDQAHFIRDFRRFTGAAPGALLERSR
jgi:AraC-like DNA-binding protein